MPQGGNGPHQVGRAWLWLCMALALHVTDEALTGFLSVYNPTAQEIRQQIPWLPVPIFRFDEWLAGLMMAVVLLLFLSIFVFRGDRWIRPLAWVFAVLMTANAVGHTAGTIMGRTFESIPFARPMPGFYSSPVLAAAALWLMYRLRAADYER